MKKYLLVLLCCFFIFLLSPAHIFSAEKSADDYYSELIDNFRSYQQTLGPFNTAKSQHAAYKTLDTEVALLGKSKKMLLSETVAMESYAHFVRARLAEATKILSYQENYLYIKLDDEIAFFTSVREKISSASLLSEMSLIADELEKHYELTQNYGYQVKSLIEVLSAKKVWENIKIEKEKLSNFLVAFPDDLKVKAAYEKVEQTKKDFEEISGLLSRADSSLKSFSQGNGKGVSAEIHRLLAQSIEGFSRMVSVFINVVNSI